MPKEHVESRYHGQTAGDGVTPLETTHAHVGWTKSHGHVELAVVNPAVAGEGESDPRAGWFVQLDRTGINRLIRVLRTARDQAFGRDE